MSSWLSSYFRIRIRNRFIASINNQTKKYKHNPIEQNMMQTDSEEAKLDFSEPVWTELFNILSNIDQFSR